MLHCRERPGPGRPVLLIHGNFASSVWWTPLLESAGQDHRLLAPDLPGCGSSPPPSSPSGYALDRVARALLALCDERSVERFHLVGHSLGAAVAIHLVDQAPDRVIDLALFGPAPLDGLAGMRTGNGEMGELLRQLDPSDPAKLRLLRFALDSARLIGTHKYRLEAALKAQMPAARLDGIFFRELREIAARQSTATILGYLQALGEVDHRDRARRIRVPVSIVWGALDTLVPRAAVETMAQSFPFGELSIWPSVGHAPMLEAPERTLSHLLDLWARSAAELAETGPVRLPASVGKRGLARPLLHLARLAKAARAALGRLVEGISAALRRTFARVLGRGRRRRSSDSDGTPSDSISPPVGSSPSGAAASGRGVEATARRGERRRHRR